MPKRTTDWKKHLPNYSDKALEGFTYDPYSGEIGYPHKSVGKMQLSDGQIMFIDARKGLKGNKYLASRLALQLVGFNLEGRTVINDNGNPRDNRLENLTALTPQERNQRDSILNRTHWLEHRRAFG